VGTDVVLIGGTSSRDALLELLGVMLVLFVLGVLAGSVIVGLILVAIAALLVGPGLGRRAWKWRRAARFAQSHGWDSANCALGYVEFFYRYRWVPRLYWLRERGWARFTPIGGVVRGLPYPGEYALVSSTTATGSADDWIYVRAAGCRVAEGPYRGLMLAMLNPAVAKSASGELSISTPQGDYARAVARPVGPGQVEAVVEAWLVRAKAARLELVAKTPPRARIVNLIPPRAHKVKLAESRGGAVREVVDLRGLAGPKVVIVAGTPGSEALNLFRNGIAGLGPGPSYALRLVLDVPLARDVAVEREITPTSF